MTPLTAGRRQRGPDTRAAVACYYAGDPALRPHCTVTAEITLGPVPLCGSCGRARSTLGKGIVPASLPPGPQVERQLLDPDRRPARHHPAGRPAALQPRPPPRP